LIKKALKIDELLIAAVRYQLVRFISNEHGL